MIQIFQVTKSSLWGFREPGFNKLLVQACREIPGMAWEPSVKAWVGYIDAVIAAFSVLRRMGLAVDDSLVPDGLSDKYLTERGAPILLPGIGANGKPGAKNQAREYQKVGVKFLLHFGAQGCILGDVMGLGKTLQAILAAKSLGPNARVVIVTPGYVRGVWSNAVDGGQLRRWWPELREVEIYQPQGLKGDVIPTEARVVLTHYSLVASWLDDLQDWGPTVLILDEPHLGLVGEETKRSKAIRVLRDGVSYCWALTGTPMTSRPRDMWNLLATISPGRFGTKFFNFGKRYCGGAEIEIAALGETRWNFDGSSNEEELSKRLTPWILLRRTVEEVGLELPAKTRQVIWSEGGKAGEAMARVLAGVKSMRDVRAMLDRAADAKLKETIELLAGYAESGKRVVAFTYRRHVAEMVSLALTKNGLLSAFIHGGSSNLSRAKTAKRFADLAESDPSRGFVLVGTLDSCATGIDLTFVQVVVFVEITPDAQELLQAESRAHRPGQREPVLVQYFLRKGTADELIAEKVISKLDTFEKIVGKVEGERLFARAEKDILAELLAGVGE